jgi:hypothetical protein
MKTSETEYDMSPTAMPTLYLTKSPKTYNVEWTTSSTNGAGKSGGKLRPDPMPVTLH